MAGEMGYIDPQTGEDDSGNVWSLHAAVARAVGGRLAPFDQYQGPCIVVGLDLRVGDPPYAVPVRFPGTVRLWIGSDGEDAYVYREDTNLLEYFPDHCGTVTEAAAIGAAMELMEGRGQPNPSR